MHMLINASYYLICLFVVFILIVEIVKTRKIQQAVLYGVILIPFVLRVLHLK